MLRKSPALDDWAKIFKNTDLFPSSSNVTKFNKV